MAKKSIIFVAYFVQGIYNSGRTKKWQQSRYQMLKIDLYNNTSTFIKESTQDRAIDLWAREQGLDLKTLTTHPCVRDIQTLLDFDQLSHLMTPKDKQIWTHAWQWVAVKQLPINVYIQKRLSSIVENCTRIQSIRARKHRQATRASKQRDEIGDHNDEAKGSQSVPGPIYGQVQQDDGSARIRARQIIEVR